MKKLAFLLLLSLLPPRLAPATLVPDDFAFGMPVSLAPGSAAYRIVLPQKVYETVARPDLGDIRVFNANTVAVPHLLRRQDQTASFRSETELPFFPWYGNKQEQKPPGLKVTVEGGANRDSRITISPGHRTAPGQKVKGYILDARHLDAPIEELDFSFDTPQENQVVSVTLEHSSDLSGWTPLLPRAGLAKLRFRGHEIIQTAIRLDRPHKAFVRIRWVRGGPGLVVKKVRALKSEAGPKKDIRTWTPLEGTQQAPEPDDKSLGKTFYGYDSRAVFPVDRIRIHFPEENSVKHLSFDSRRSDRDKWHPHGGKTLFHLNFNETVLVKDTFFLSATPHPLWRIGMKGDFPGTPARAPKIFLGWVPHELIFVAQGDGPFLLAFGSARLQPEESALHPDEKELLYGILGRDNENLVKTAELLSETVLGGEERLAPEPPPLPWKKWLLWATLIAGVAVIALMAASLGRSMKKEP